ncbi:MAG: integrase [Calditrichia bacterium]|jgi:hypothetical protein|nr:integrase [Calditrichia bacterium]
MSNESKNDYLSKIKPRYLKASKLEKEKILDEFCLICGYNRKYAIRKLNAKNPPKNKYEYLKRGPKSKYDHPDIEKVLRTIWINTNLPCSKRLKTILQIWIPFYPKYISDQTEKALLEISPATIDRIMQPWRTRYTKRGLSTTKPGTILKKHIPVKTKQWDETKPGFLDADTVAHCGDTVAGMFVYTLNFVDIATGWNEQRAAWRKGEHGVLIAIQNIEESLPFDILGFDCDNGSEFLNWHLLRYLSERKQPNKFTRARAYHKNDNAHIEGKNWTHIRQYLGYQRFENIELVDMLNDLYTKEWNLYFNFFIPYVKLVDKQRVGSKIIKKHDTPKTPFQRILESEQVSEKIKSKLRKQFENLDPFKLQKHMSTKIIKILNVVNQSKKCEIKPMNLSTIINTYSQKEERKKEPKKERRKTLLYDD